MPMLKKSSTTGSREIKKEVFPSSQSDISHIRNKQTPQATEYKQPPTLMAKQLREGFKNANTYAAGMEIWVKNNYPSEMKYTFSADFARMDWLMGIKGVLDTYELIKKGWLDNYKAFTEAVVSINMLAWAHYQLKQQGYDGRDTFIELYTDLYHQATNDFYEYYKDNEEARCYFFQMTD